MITENPRKAVSLTGMSAVEKRVDHMQYTENSAVMTVTIVLGVPSQMRVALSLSYFLKISAADFSAASLFT